MEGGPRGSVQKIDLVSSHVIKTIQIAPDAGSETVKVATAPKGIAFKRW